MTFVFGDTKMKVHSLHLSKLYSWIVLPILCPLCISLGRRSMKYEDCNWGQLKKGLSVGSNIILLGKEENGAGLCSLSLSQI